MPRPSRHRAVPLGLVGFAYGLALLQRPGLISADTKVNLHVDAARFLGDVASTWSATGDLGHVQGGQYGGYLFPMGPFFALGHAVGLGEWVVERLWLGSLLAVAALGVLKLMDALWSQKRGLPHVAAALVFVLNPYVIQFASRTTVSLLAYAALPWLLLAAHRGVHRGGWGWPALFALVVTASGGGVNAAVLAWVLVGPVLLLLYEPLVGGTSWRAARGFVMRAAVLAIPASMWWMLPVLVQSHDGVNFLQFIEQPGTIWATSSVTESLRLMGYWVSYLGVGFGDLRAQPYFADARLLLFSLPVVVATLLVPAAAVGGFVWTRRWRYGPFFALLAITGLVIMTVGFPEGTPLRKASTFAYNHVAAVQFLRTTYKAGPLLALALACLIGGAAPAAWAWLRARPGRWVAPAGATAAIAVLAGAAWPLSTGRAVGRDYALNTIPAAWRAAARDADRAPSGTRAAVLPGQLFAFYRWGSSYDPIAPVLAKRPVAQRTIVPYGDLRGTDLLWTLDGLVQQRRAYPGQLPALLRLIGVGTVLSGTDDDLRRSGAVDPAVGASSLAEGGLGRAAGGYGRARSFEPEQRTLEPARSLPEVRRFEVAGARPLVRVQARTPAAVIDGSAATIVALAAVGGLPQQGSLVYAADLSRSRLRAAARRGAEVVIGDSNRRRPFVNSTLFQTSGLTLAADDNVSEDGAILDPFGTGRGGNADMQTVARYAGLRSLRAPYSPSYPQFPEHRPFAAVDGSLRTAWYADLHLTEPRRVLELGFGHPRDVPYVDLWPVADEVAMTGAVKINGRRFDLHPGRNRLNLALRGVSTLSVLIAHNRIGTGSRSGAGGVAELRVPGLHPREWLRPPVDAAHALRGADLRHTPLTVLLERTTGDTPWRRTPLSASPQRFKTEDRGDGETGLMRELVLPAARPWVFDGWASVAPDAPDDQLDRLAGDSVGGSVFRSASRYEGLPSRRASRAFDGDPATAWIGAWIKGRPTWLSWRGPRPVTVRRLLLVPPAEPVSRPTRVRLRWPGGDSGPVTVGADGRVELPRAVRTAQLRIDVLAAAPPVGATAIQRRLRAVGIAEVRGLNGLAPVGRSRAAGLAAPCGALTGMLGARRFALAVSGRAADFEAGRPLRARGCGAPLAGVAGTTDLVLPPTPAWRIDLLRLASPAPDPLAVAAARPGRVVDQGKLDGGRLDGARVSLREPATLVLGESYAKGWRARCDGRSLGAPVPVDGYANGWDAPADCRSVEFSFAPDATVRAGYWISIAAVALLLLGLAGAALRRRRDGTTRATEDEPAPLAIDDAPQPWPWRRAASMAVAAGLVLGFCFAIRLGILVVPFVFLVLTHGVAPRRLIIGSAALLGVVVPALYLALSPSLDRGGYDFAYALDHIAAHWVGVAGVVLWMVAIARGLGPAVSTATPPTPAPEQPGAAAGSAPPSPRRSG